MRKLAALIALVFAFMAPAFGALAFDADSSGLNSTAEGAYGEQVTNDANRNLGTFIGKYIIQPVIGLTGIVFLVLTVYAGMMWMTAAGDAKRIQKAKDILIASITGAVIIASAYAIVGFVIGALAQ